MIALRLVSIVLALFALSFILVSTVWWNTPTPASIQRQACEVMLGSGAACRVPS